MDKRNSARQFEIASSDGWDHIEFQIRMDDVGMDETAASISVRGKFWDRTFPSDSYNLVDDFDVTFQQSVLSRSKLGELRDALKRWMRDLNPIAVELSSHALPLIRLELGPAEEIISSREKPVFVLSYSDSRIETSVKFVVDQSCIQLFLDGLIRALR